MAFRRHIPPQEAQNNTYNNYPNNSTAPTQLPPSLSGQTMQHPDDSQSQPSTATSSPNLRKRQRVDASGDGAHHNPAQAAPVAPDAFIQDNDAAASGGDDDDEDEEKPKSDKKAGRRKIKIEFIQDKSRRHITFSKRKAGIMKKAYELSTLTGTQVLLLVVSETGLVYTFTTAKLQPLVTQPEGKNLIQACLNAPHGTVPSSMPVGTPIGRSSNAMNMGTTNNVPGGLSIGGQGKDEEGGDDDAEGGRTRGPEKRRRRASSTAGQASSSAPAQGRGGPGGSPHSPTQQIPPPTALNIPPGAPQQQQQQPPSGHSQIALGSPTTSGPPGGGNPSQQQPGPPGSGPPGGNYAHGPPPPGYGHHPQGDPGAPPMYQPQHGMMPPPPGYYQHGAPHLPSPGQWGPPPLQGGPQYARR